ncbi:MAG: hypothetical protein DMF90_15330 [Acidobacteria bacterium]|nr:MAG: hypothetical protein DMF90_15330 [Acidobacteriota bacterium]
MSRSFVALSLALLVASAASLRADVRADEKTLVQFAGGLGRVINFFGGKAAREGVTSVVAVKGDRKSSLNDTTGQIIDLNEEKIYQLDPKRKTYKVVTFAELRRQMEEAQKKAEDARRQGGADTPPPPQANEQGKEYEVDFDVKNTGETKTINGFNTHQAVVTVTVREKGKTLEQNGGLVMTTDMWLAPSIPAMKEIAAFDIRYAQKLYGPMVANVSAQDMAAATAMYPMLKPALAKMSAEGGKIEGTPILTAVSVDAVKSQEQLAQEQKQSGESDSAKTSSTSSMPKSVGGLLGGLAKKAAPKKEPDAGPKARVTFMTTTHEVLKVATEVNAADLSIPNGFKENK